MTNFDKICVIGAGVMGAQIAGHFANAGFRVNLLDIVPKNEKNRNKLALDALAGLPKLKPNPLFKFDFVKLITPCNLEDDLDAIKEADLIIEAIIENFEIKRALFEKIDKIKKQTAIVTTNTSGIGVNKLSQGLSDSFRKNFLGTHFFNPPRYMKLVEIIKATDTDPATISKIHNLLEINLGKGLVYTKDTPNFIANRIGLFAIMNIIKHTLEENYTVSEVDAITGRPLARPKTACFRTLDLVGIDTLCYVVKNSYEVLTNDKERNIFKIPEFLNKMVQKKLLGTKAGQGFYKKVKKDGKSEILVLDYKTLEHKTQEKPKFASLAQLKLIENKRERLKAFVFGKDRASELAWKTLSDTLIYSANIASEISDDIISIDNAMKWGFNWDLGPFETWDALGTSEIVKRLEKEKREVPQLVQNISHFYKEENSKSLYFDFKTNDHKEIKRDKDKLSLKILKKADQNKIIKKNAGASLIDIGDDVALLEFHAKMNAIGPDIISLMQQSIELVKQDFKGLVISNEAQNFCVGANLALILMNALDEEWDDITMIVKNFQKANMSLKYAPFPVVSAPFGYTFGGGCEVVLHTDAVCALAETYIGLVEVGVGVIPAGGGTKEMTVRAGDNVPKGTNLFPYIQKTFETIGMAKVATSACEAFDLGFFRDKDSVTMNKDFLIKDAKEKVISLARNYKRQHPRKDIRILGESGKATFLSGLYNFKEANFISEYDMHVGKKLVHILCGGDLGADTLVTEQYLLDLEQEAFMSLLGEKKTIERIQHMLKIGKPLRN